MGIQVTPREFTETVRPVSDFPTPHGLFSVVQNPESGSARWLNGLEWEHASCAAVSGVAGTCEEPVGLPYNITNGRQEAEAATFMLYGSHKCAPVGSDPAAAQQFAADNLLRHEQEGVEDAISSGSLGTIPTFIGATDLTPAAAASGVPLSYAIGLLSSYAASVFGTAGSVIHAPRVLAGFFETPHNLSVPASDDQLALTTGELISLGGGYANLDPAGDPAEDGTAWVTITPPVMLLSSDISTIPPDDPLSTLDRSNNELVAVARRHYLVAWDDCTLAAVKVDLNAQ